MERGMEGQGMEGEREKGGEGKRESDSLTHLPVVRVMCHMCDV